MRAPTPVPTRCESGGSKVSMLFRSVLALAFAPAVATAQLPPDAPRLISPHGSGGASVHWVRSENFPGAQGALLATWAMPAMPRGMRLRAGAGQGAGGESAFFGGVDYQVPLLRRATGRGLELDWQTGLGLSAGDYSLLSLPVGLSAGVSLSSGPVWVAPFVTGGVAADLRMGDAAPEKEFLVEPTLEAGIDLAFDAERRVLLRAATGLLDRRAVSLGFAVGVGRLVR